MINQVTPGLQANQDGVINTARAGRTGEAMVSELQGRFYENCYRGNLYSNGVTETALSANTISLSATTTPILGVWNPPTSTVNLVILQASLAVTLQAASSTRAGALVWASSVGNTAISTGSAPFNRKTLSLSGSQAKGMSFVALTGLTNNLVIFEGSELVSGPAITTASVPATANVPVISSVENFDGNLIVPPGGVLALLNTVSTANISVAGRLLWAEVAL